MDFGLPMFSQSLVWAGNLFYALLLIVLLKGYLPGLFRDTQRFNVWLGCIVAITILWSLRAELDNGLNMHLLGAGFMAMMFGWHLGLAGMAMVNTIAVGLGFVHWENWGLNGLIYTLYPVSISYFLFLLAEARLPRHFFIYIFATAFFGAWLTVAMTALLSTGTLAFSDQYSMHTLTDVFLPLMVVMGFAEAFLTGGHLSIFVVYKPDWVYTFRDDRYIKGK